MKLNRKLLVIAKGISVWWGIYLILACCAGFAVKMLQTLTMTAKPFELMKYMPLIVVMTLILAVITYFISEIIKNAPRRKIRRELYDILDEEGFSSGYISKLFDSARGDLKYICFIEAACVYCLRGEYDYAEKTLSAVDLVSISDISASTGDYRTVAYYYCVRMMLNVIKGDKEATARAYDEGIHYLEMLSGNAIITAVLALYQTRAGLYNSSIDTIEKIRWTVMPKRFRKYGIAFAAYVKACNLLNMGKYDDAVLYARKFLEAPCTEYIAEEAEEIIRQAKSRRHITQ